MRYLLIVKGHPEQACDALFRRIGNRFSGRKTGAQYMSKVDQSALTVRLLRDPQNALIERFLQDWFEEDKMTSEPRYGSLLYWGKL